MSSGPWKRHKYFQKIGEGANAVYRYAKNNVADKISGDYYDKKAEEYEKEAEDIEQHRFRLQDAVLKSASNNHNIKQDKLREANEAYIEKGLRQHGELNDKQIDAEYNARKMRKKAENSIGEKITGKRAKANMEKYAKNEYKNDEIRYDKEKKKYEKTLAGKVEKTKKKFKDKVSSEEKVTIKDTMTGETRTPNKNADDLFNIKKKKYVKHDGFSFEVEDGQVIIDRLLGRE